MKLYHFTCSGCVAGVLRQGLTAGRLLVDVRHSAGGAATYEYERGYQWLTRVPDPAAQTWHSGRITRCDRLEWRLTVQVPRSARPWLLGWRDVLARVTPAAAVELAGAPGCTDWYAFAGTIPAPWLGHLHHRSGAPVVLPRALAFDHADAAAEGLHP